MANMRQAKKRLKALLEGPGWQENLEQIAAGGLANTGALFSFLLYDPEFMHRAARALGLTTAAVCEKNPEAARNIIRRFMWHMNEDSGNIGWGIPDAFAETLAASRRLAESYASILLSYIMELGFADNYCDHAPLRRECYWAAGHLAQAWPDLAEKARPWLARGLGDEDSLCRGVAAWALGQLGPGLMEAPSLAALARAGDEDECVIFDGGVMRTNTVSGWAACALARKALGRVHS